MKTIRIGCGAGFSGDRIEPAIELATQGALDYLVFECLAERTIAQAQQAKSRDPHAGYDPLLEDRLEAVLPACYERHTRIITNMGAANPLAAADAAKKVARRLGLHGLSVAAVTGDDVLDLVTAGEYVLDETGEPVATLAPSSARGWPCVSWRSGCARPASRQTNCGAISSDQRAAWRDAVGGTWPPVRSPCARGGADANAPGGSTHRE